MSSFPEPLELDELDAHFEEDPAVFERITAVPGAAFLDAPPVALPAPVEEDPISGLHPRSEADGLEPPGFREPVAELDSELPPVLAGKLPSRKPRAKIERPGSETPGAEKPRTPSTRGRKSRPTPPPALELELELDDIRPGEPKHMDQRHELEIELSAPAPSGPAPSAPALVDPELLNMRDRYATGDFTGALFVAESILAAAPEHDEAQRCHERCSEVLSQMYLARLGSLAQVVRVALPSDQIRWLSLDHRSGFLLSLVDGQSSIEELLDISGMQRLDALRILFGLLDQRVIALCER